MSATRSRIELPAGQTAPQVARRFVTERLGNHPRSEDVKLAVSELVTNVLHFGELGVSDALRLTLTMEKDGQIRVEVLQPGVFSFTAHETFPGADHLRGRGLAVVAALATRWGVDHGDDASTVVWFEMA